MAQAFVSAAFCVSIGDTSTSKTPNTCALHRFHTSSVPQIATFFTRGAPLTLFWRTSCRRKLPSKATSVSIKCEQSTKNSNSLDVWLGRLAMVGFSVALSVEIATGKGLLENFGLTAPLPTVALAVTALVVALTALFIFQSSSRN